MIASETAARTDVLAFAAEFPTPNVLQAVEYAKAGRLTWTQIYGLCQRSLGEALVIVSK